MHKIERVLIAGLGAIGGTVASQIYDSNPQAVCVLASGERFTRYKKNGIFINNVKYDFTLVEPQSVSENTSQRVFDLIIIACKNQHLEQVRSDIKYYVGENTLILSLLNGITSEEFLAEVYGMERIPYAMILGTDAQHGTSENGESHTHFIQKGIIHFGDAENDRFCLSERICQITDFFDRYSIAYEIPENMIHRLWYKFMVNVGINQCSAVLRLPYGAFQTNGNAQALMESAMKEVIALSQKIGIGLNESSLALWYETLNSLTPQSRTSMCQDVLAKRKTEVELFAQAVVALGKKQHMNTPVNEFLYNALRAIESTYAFL